MSGLGLSDCGPLSRFEDVSRCFELFKRDEWLVGLFLGPDPIGLVVPSHFALVTEGDVVHVDEYFISTLLVPHLAAGVSRVLKYDLHSVL